MSNEFTPTTEDARDRYADARVGVGEWTRFDESVKRAVDEAYAEFNRWLAKVKAEAQVEALREVAKDRERLDAAARTGMNEYGGPFAGNAAKGVRDYLHARADRIARETGIDSKGESNG